MAGNRDEGADRWRGSFVIDEAAPQTTERGLAQREASGTVVSTISKLTECHTVLPCLTL